MTTVVVVAGMGIAGCSDDDGNDQAETSVAASAAESPVVTSAADTVDTATDVGTGSSTSSTVDDGGATTPSSAPASEPAASDTTATPPPVPGRDPLGPVPEEWPDSIPAPNGLGVDSEVISGEPDDDELSIFIGGPESTVGEEWLDEYLAQLDAAGVERILDLSYEDSSVVTFDDGTWQVSVTRGPGFEGTYIGINFIPTPPE